MEPAFWQQRWADNQIGFHQAQVNPYLQTYWPQLQLAPGSRVLVPLCGKSLDLAWLAGQGHRVLGVELSRRAVEDFFREHGLEAEVRQQGAFEVWRSGDVQLWCGDFFALRAEDVADCVGLYDRAAVIALPVQMRARYMQLLSGLLPTSCRGLVVTLDYDQSLLAGPPFSVRDEELRQGFAGWQVEQLEAVEVIEESPKFVQAGASSLLERVYRLSR
ncbi:thiopurine S-methyltransferase [Pseudomonas alloputida]|uniref:Thiopurine S-methyltransferase n=4 Tax=Pseudomonas TaxID=286 RepID=TPMT_PSEP1|nr:MULTISPECIES: thiopurine S-methyltransferase [Pseudomonas]A5W759.1 RecName: Full=Thiopurine S-methyltransferase; AltName: Full=Thiopurine methyltransferase [Pseudomonas putida F1]EKT4479618.1 thiopurine S-methyltransferase [Pseudomonas putida]MCX2707081.1 thiopurine S-methyltransferase [Pseudomonas sp. DCB_BG]MDD2001040.1 thiopurine S-methyltransferase [Pseudomonas putida]MDD2142470.1 thiopurine S-methyltransferase [Pseudomonas putida]MDD2148672.1 thiopurine S-methyltransferase [Pseudomona